MRLASVAAVKCLLCVLMTACTEGIEFTVPLKKFDIYLTPRNGEYVIESSLHHPGWVKGSKPKARANDDALYPHAGDILKGVDNYDLTAATLAEVVNYPPGEEI
jgi:hypothetical protein